VTTSLDFSVDVQDHSSSVPQHYEELTNVTKRLPMPLYEPLNQTGNDNQMDYSIDQKTYEQLQQNAPGREYQPLKSYNANIRSKV
jgi:hypothetical protein